jgi:putative membrane protein
MMFGGGMFIGLIVLVLFLVLIGVAVIGGIWLISRGTGSDGLDFGQRSAPPREDPLEILKQRYARGEITREEYETMREDLMR